MVSRAKASGGTMALHCSQAKLWVKTHYERHPEGVVAKAVMYKHYEDYCRDNGRNIMETSIFGRVVKSVFPDVTIRRLGGRDNLKYYYCGIQAKETSPHAGDNATTTRPKRRLRKRELPTDKTDVHRCLLWLHKNYHLLPDASVLKAEVYDRYVGECVAGVGDPLSTQHFAMVLSHAFPHAAGRRLGPRANQHKFYFGIQERAAPLPLDTAPGDLHGAVELMFSNGRLCYREELHPDDDDEDDDDDDDDDCGCRSPVSDTSDGSLRDTHTPLLGANHHYLLHQPFRIKEEPEPVDYSLQHLKLKDEPLEEDEYTVKDEPLDLHVPRDDVLDMDMSYLSEGSSQPSGMMGSAPGFVGGDGRDAKARRVYKPRFRAILDGWVGEGEEDQYPGGSAWECRLREWLTQALQECASMCVNRDQVYAHYRQDCEALAVTALPLTVFDETVMKVFRGVVTMIQSPEKTFYRGVRAAPLSPLGGQLEELLDDRPLTLPPHRGLEPPPATAPRASPLLEDERSSEGQYEHYVEEESGAGRGGPREGLRDGKYYLSMWLTDNFESVPDSCVLKAEAYHHYEQYARAIKQTPFEMNVFGKIVRQVFPKVSIRRLGGRVKPQYHYCGIAVKPSSHLFQFMAGKDPAQRSRKKEIATDNKSAEMVIEWLRCQYEAGSGHVTMKSAVFSAYCAYCKVMGENPVTLNYFGKLVKHCFPNVEVRKCGGRSEPTWYYFGLVPLDAAGDALLMPHRDAPAHAHSSSPIPICLQGGAAGGLLPHHPYPGSPGSPMMDGLEDPRRLLLARSPYEPGDVPPDTLYSRSPGDSSAQYCRSPREVLLLGGGDSPRGHCHSPADTFPPSPLEAAFTGGTLRPRHPQAGGGGGGGQVVPRFPHPHLQYGSPGGLGGLAGSPVDIHAHKRHKAFPEHCAAAEIHLE
ncbi:Transcription factor RFX4 [Chionoecetes opilio]|uniref:Transcription factor RFX4 n=1 Tax=Chionoecetes opilio TaxID=41210 RepID=A0A8J4YH07_CHIOP|nr:Transcription factor RFX4 [Chionoecetes opilio]